MDILLNKLRRQLMRVLVKDMVRHLVKVLGYKCRSSSHLKGAIFSPSNEINDGVPMGIVKGFGALRDDIGSRPCAAIDDALPVQNFLFL